MTGPQDLLAGRYRLVDRIAVGGMGEVWRAQDLLLSRLVAVKTLKPEFVGDEDFRARFRAEARHAGRLAHPGIASVYDFGESPDCAWLVMELVDGESLSALLRREGVLPVARALDVVAQTAAALQAAHDGGVVHRDVKPGNLLVRPDGTVKVTDFGVASATDAVPLTRTGHVIGTAYYLSPEQAAGRSASPASDVYALGVVAYECLTGGRPFPGENPVAVALAHLRSPVPPLPDSVPAPVRALVERALAKDPAQRFPDAAALSVAAAAARAGLHGDEPVPARTAVRGHDDALEPTGLLEVVPMPPRRLPRPVRRLPGSRPRSSRTLVTAAAVVLAVLTLTLGVRSLSTEPPAAGPAVEPVAQASVAASSGAASPSPSAASPSPAAVRVETTAWIGRPAAEAREGLAELGLVPRLAYDGRGLAVGTVSGVEPAGAVQVGSTVLLHVVPVRASAAPVPVAPAPAPVTGGKEPPKGPGDRGKGRGKK
jgi:serine/threonine protein kinase